MRKSGIFSISITVLLLIALLTNPSCSSKKDSIHDVTRPSEIYANNDTVLLGTFAHNGYQTASYFCASLKEEVQELLNQKNKKGAFIYRKKDGKKYDLYRDELKVYTTIDPQLQKYAETAVYKHLKTDLQPAFSKNNQAARRFPFSNTFKGRKVTDQTIENIMSRSRKSSSRYESMILQGYSPSEIEKSFTIPTSMQLFSWNGPIDTLLSPNDSIRYMKNFIQAGLISIEPSTGEVKAWVGGIDHDNFPFDRVRQGKRQMGSTIKPFTYAAAFSMGVIEPCTTLPPDNYCVDPCEPSGKRWCPAGIPKRDLTSNFIYSGGGVNVSVMSLMGACSGPQAIDRIFKQMNIHLPEDQIVPSICLGTPDMSLMEITSANTIFVNNGTYVTPRIIRRIEDKHGNVIYASKRISQKVIYETYSFDVLQLMKLVVERGTSAGLKWHEEWGGIPYPTAGITGTTQANSDMWFVGMTPSLVTGVWTGGEYKQIRFRSKLWGQGARASLPIYGYYMQQVYNDSTLKISTDDFPPPESYDPARFQCEDSLTKTP